MILQTIYDRLDDIEVKIHVRKNKSGQMILSIIPILLADREKAIVPIIAKGTVDELEDNFHDIFDQMLSRAGQVSVNTKFIQEQLARIEEENKKKVEEKTKKKGSTTASKPEVKKPPQPDIFSTAGQTVEKKPEPVSQPAPVQTGLGFGSSDDDDEEDDFMDQQDQSDNF